MLRMIFAVGLLLFGAAQSLRGPFYGLLFYLGFAYFRPETWVWGSELQALNLSFYIGIAVVASAIVSQKEKLVFNIPVALIILFCLHSLLSTLLSAHVEWSFMWWKGFAKVTIVTILIISLVNTADRLRLTLLVMAFTLGFEGVKQGWFYLLFLQGEANANTVEILGDNNGVAVGMLMLSAVLLALFQTTRTVWQKGLFGLMLLGTIFRALSTFSRGGLLAFGAMAVMYWLRSKHKVRTAILVATVGTGLLMVMPPAYWERMNTITASEVDRDESTAGRLYFWTVALRMANDHPLLGVGTSGFQAVYDDYDTSGGLYGSKRAVHSTWLGVLAEQGYVGLTLLASIVFLAFRACGRARALTRGQPNHERIFALAGAVQAALVTAVVGGSFISYHYVEILWHFIGLSLAIGRIATLELAEERSVIPVSATGAGMPAFGAVPLSPLQGRG